MEKKLEIIKNSHECLGYITNEYNVYDGQIKHFCTNSKSEFRKYNKALTKNWDK